MSVLGRQLEWTHYPEPPDSMDGGDQWSGVGGGKEYKIYGPHGWGDGFAAYPVPHLTAETCPDGQLSFQAENLEQAKAACEYHVATARWEPASTKKPLYWYSPGAGIPTVAQAGCGEYFLSDKTTGGTGWHCWFRSTVADYATEKRAYMRQEQAKSACEHHYRTGEWQ